MAAKATCFELNSGTHGYLASVAALQQSSHTPSLLAFLHAPLLFYHLLGKLPETPWLLVDGSSGMEFGKPENVRFSCFGCVCVCVWFLSEKFSFSEFRVLNSRSLRT